MVEDRRVAPQEAAPLDVGRRSEQLVFGNAEPLGHQEGARGDRQILLKLADDPLVQLAQLEGASAGAVVLAVLGRRGGVGRPVMSRLAPTLNSRSVYITRVVRADELVASAGRSASRSEDGGTPMVNQRLYSWFRS